MATLKDRYRNEIAPKLKEELGLANVMEVPRITKITLNMGVGEAVGDKKVMESALADMTKIAGQKPVVTVARRVHRRFQDPRRLAHRLQGHAAPGAHVRVPGAPDQHRDSACARLPRYQPEVLRRRGNFAMGVSEQIIFPEINYDEVDALRGMDITITTTARTTTRAAPCCAPSTSR
jgi:large subunit ribosomal protein L5